MSKSNQAGNPNTQVGNGAFGTVTSQANNPGRCSSACGQLLAVQLVGRALRAPSRNLSITSTSWILRSLPALFREASTAGASLIRQTSFAEF